MKKRWTLRLVATAFLLLLLLVGIVLNPYLLYANKTVYGNCNIYHNAAIGNDLKQLLDSATCILKNSELYDPNLKLDICLNDGSSYPVLVAKVRGQAFAWGFYDKVVLMGNANYKDNFVVLNGWKWNLTQLLAHEETHCYQFHKLGLLKSNPVAGYPFWKWEGYAEYVSRRNADQLDLSKNIARIIEANKADKDGWEVYFADSTIAPKDYYNAWLLLQYCLDIRKMTYGQLLKDTTTGQTMTAQMMDWFAKQKTN